MQNHNQCEVDEVAALQQAIGAKELLLRERQAAFEALEQRLNSTIEQLSADLNEKQTLIGQNEIKSQQAKADISEIVEQKTRLEMLQKQTERLLSAQAEQIRAGVRAEIQSLERQLIDKQSELQNCQARVMDLQHRLAEMQLLSESRAVQIEDLKSEIVRLSQEISRREPVKLGTGSCGNLDFGHGREPEAGSGEISAAPDTNSHNSEKAETQARHEVMTLRVQESAENECAKMRNEFQAQVAFLQAELSQKDWTLQEREAAQKVLEQGLRAKIGQLEVQLEQIETSAKGTAQEFVLGVNWESEARLDDTWKLQERLDGNGAEGAQTASDQSGKWRTSGQWKRRWRSR
jgi:hypothetical protein